MLRLVWCVQHVILEDRTNQPEHHGLGIQFCEARIESLETEVERLESAEWDSESELSDLDPWLAIEDAENASASDDKPVDDPQCAEFMESWDVWNGPCVCGSKRPDQRCTSAKYINDDVDEVPQKSSSEPCSL